MPVRKYTKTFKNKASAYKFYDRVSSEWENGTLDKMYMPNRTMVDYRENGKLKFKHIITYYRSKYNPNPENKTHDSELYGGSIAEVKDKFSNLMKKNFSNYKVSVKKIKLLERHVGNFNLYRITHTMKMKK